MSQIILNNVVKDYQIRKRVENRGRFKELLNPQYTYKRALDGINLDIKQGEMIGYLGVNGAGKSTTIKILTGILSPTSGSVKVFGADPTKNRKKNASEIGVVFGQRSQLLWDLPIFDTFELFKIMYNIEQSQFIKQRDFLIYMLDMESFVSQAARQLSLGQKMRANLALCFLYHPSIVYLDEPTIGLDIVVKDKIRAFLKDMNREFGTTILLTTHDTQDIEEVAERLILIDHGKMIFDGSQKAFKTTYKDEAFILEASFVKPTGDISHSDFESVDITDYQHTYRISYADMTPGEAISFVSSHFSISDIRVRESGLEELLKKIYTK